LTRIKAPAWTVDDVARLMEFVKKELFIYLFLPSVLEDDKIGSITKLYKTLLYSIYLFIIRIFRTFRPAGCKTGCTGYSGLQPVV